MAIRPQVRRASPEFKKGSWGVARGLAIILVPGALVAAGCAGVYYERQGGHATTQPGPAAASAQTAGVVSPAGTPIASPGDRGGYDTTFTFHPTDDKPSTVAVAGDFNDWSKDATPMAANPDGFFSTHVRLSPGPHYYKFVLDGQRWIADPAGNSQLGQPDNYGGSNSGVIAGPKAEDLPKVANNEVRPDTLFFDATDPRDLEVISPTLLKLSLRARDGGISRAVAWVSTGGSQWSPHELLKIDSAYGLTRYSVALATDGPAARYAFELRHGSGAAFVASGLAYNAMEQAQANAYSTSLVPSFDTPDWARKAVWYQIFPERFRNGDPANDPEHSQRWQSKWFSTLPGETGTFYNDVWGRMYGGDVQGLRQELPYLKKLGITAIYLNPMFKARSQHKYDTEDYRHIDDHFGFKGDLADVAGETEDPATWKWTRTDRLFLDFVAEAHAQGFKVILDGVFNHVGREFFAFQDVLKNGKDSKYADWFDVTDFGPPLHYKAWDKDDGALPVFKKDPQTGLAEGPHEYILSVARRWIAPDGKPGDGVDGFRLDVPGDIPHPFWVEFRKVVKGLKPDAYISGEIWPMAQDWLHGDQFDGVMNYQFAMAVQSFFVNQKTALPPTEMARRTDSLLQAYPYASSLVLQNLVDSHDTDRFASMFVNPDRPFDAADRIQDNGPDYSPAKPSEGQWARLRQAVTFQMTYPGAPMIYYGDETGMWGPDDPSDRQPMVWKDLEPYDDPGVKFDDGLFAHYQRAIAVRRALPVLQAGLYRPVLTDDRAGVFAFARDLDHRHAYVVLNRSPRERTVTLNVDQDDASQPLFDWMDPRSCTLETAGPGRPVLKPSRTATGYHAGSEGAVRLTLPAYGSAVLSAVPG